MHLAGTKRRDIRKITDRHVEGVRNLLARSVRPPASSIFRPRKKLPAVVMWDSKVPGLFVRIGHHKVTWTFQKEYRTRGKRGTTFRRLGFYPAMGILAARKAALMYAGQIASGKPMPGLRDAVTLDQALGIRPAPSRAIEAARQACHLGEGRPIQNPCKYWRLMLDLGPLR